MIPQEELADHLKLRIEVTSIHGELATATMLRRNTIIADITFRCTPAMGIALREFRRLGIPVNMPTSVAKSYNPCSGK